ncbi:MAG TPA: ATP-binding protein [Bryobacteraceae bacterium]|nr:ATP-binding protein [Bryobacteraceae bacterium]
MADHEGAQAHTLDLTLDSSLESVDSAEEAVLREATEAGFEEDDLHKIGIAVRECMVNAVVHGNRYNARKKVQLKVARAAGRIVISIADEGEGFDPAAVPDPLASENLLRFSGRGVMLMQAFMDEFQVSPREPRGTEVKMVKYKAKTS